MKVGEIIASVLELILKLAVLIFLITLIYKWAQTAYDYGYRVFTEDPVSVGEGRIISVEITDGQSAKDIGEMLQDKGLIRDSKVFILQELLSDHRGEEVPGIYDLSTAMTGEEILDVICPDPEAEETADDSEALQSDTSGSDVSDTDAAATDAVEAEGTEDDSVMEEIQDSEEESLDIISEDTGDETTVQ